MYHDARSHERQASVTSLSFHFILCRCLNSVGRYSWVGIATRYVTDILGIEGRWGRDNSHPSKPDAECCPTSYTIGTGSSSEIKRPEIGFEHPPAYSAEVEEKVELRIYSPSGPPWPVIGWIIKTINDNVIVPGLLTVGDMKIGTVWNTAFRGNLSAGLAVDRWTEI